MSDPSRCNWGSGIERFVGVAEMGLARLIHDLHPAASAPFIQRQTVRDPKKSGTRLARKIIFTQKTSPVSSNFSVYCVVCSSTSEFFCIGYFLRARNVRFLCTFCRYVQNSTQDSLQFLANPEINYHFNLPGVCQSTLIENRIDLYQNSVTN